MGEGAGGMAALSGRTSPQAVLPMTFDDGVLITIHISKKIPVTCPVGSKKRW